jgi:uncharacterized protein (TIGR03435 family)
MKGWNVHNFPLASGLLLGVAGILGVIMPVRLLESQVPAGKPSFEVASVKPSAAGDNPVAIRSQPGGR